MIPFTLDAVVNALTYGDAKHLMFLFDYFLNKFIYSDGFLLSACLITNLIQKLNHFKWLSSCYFFTD